MNNHGVLKMVLSFSFEDKKTKTGAKSGECSGGLSSNTKHELMFLTYLRPFWTDFRGQFDF